jgi:hypothetical protein
MPFLATLRVARDSYKALNFRLNGKLKKIALKFALANLILAFQPSRREG